MVRVLTIATLTSILALGCERAKDSSSGAEPDGEEAPTDASSGSSCQARLALAEQSESPGSKPSDCGEGLGTYLTMYCGIGEDTQQSIGSAVKCMVLNSKGEAVGRKLEEPAAKVRVGGELLDATISFTDAGDRYDFVVRVAGREVDPKQVESITVIGAIENQSVSLFAVPSTGDLLVQTSKDMTLYVSERGVDQGECDTPAAPCKTISRALGRIPFKIAHKVRVLVEGPKLASASLTIPTYFIEGADSGLTGSLEIVGMKPDFSDEQLTTLEFDKDAVVGLRVNPLGGGGSIQFRALALVGTGDTAMLVKGSDFVSLATATISGWKKQGILLIRGELDLIDTKIENQEVGVQLTEGSQLNVRSGEVLFKGANTGLGLWSSDSKVVVFPGATLRVIDQNLGLVVTNSNVEQHGDVRVDSTAQAGMILDMGTQYRAVPQASLELIRTNMSLAPPEGHGAAIWLDDASLLFDGSSAASAGKSGIKILPYSNGSAANTGVYAVGGAYVRARSCLECYGEVKLYANSHFWLLSPFGDYRDTKVLRASNATSAGSGKIVRSQDPNLVAHYWIVDDTGLYCHVPTAAYIVPGAFLSGTAMPFSSVNAGTISDLTDQMALLKFTGDCQASDSPAAIFGP